MEEVALLNLLVNWSTDKEKTLDTEQEAGWAPEPVWALWLWDISDICATAEKRILVLRRSTR